VYKKSLFLSKYQAALAYIPFAMLHMFLFSKQKPMILKTAIYSALLLLETSLWQRLVSLRM